MDDSQKMMKQLEVKVRLQAKEMLDLYGELYRVDKLPKSSQKYVKCCENFIAINHPTQQLPLTNNCFHPDEKHEETVTSGACVKTDDARDSKLYSISLEELRTRSNAGTDHSFLKQNKPSLVKTFGKENMTITTTPECGVKEGRTLPCKNAASNLGEKRTILKTQPKTVAEETTCAFNLIKRSIVEESADKKQSDTMTFSDIQGELLLLSHDFEALSSLLPNTDNSLSQKFDLGEPTIRICRKTFDDLRAHNRALENALRDRDKQIKVLEKRLQVNDEKKSRFVPG